MFCPPRLWRERTSRWTGSVHTPVYHGGIAKAALRSLCDAREKAAASLPHYEDSLDRPTVHCLETLV